MLASRDLSGLVDYARRFVGIPYIWGGNNPIEGFDCSGFICWLMRREGLCGVREDITAQGWYNRVVDAGRWDVFKPGALVFYGNKLSSIKHIAMLVEKDRIIEAGGGDKMVTDYELAAERNACIREMPLRYRSDLRAVIMPNYK